ncbi:SagB/ThcOx family dehydrogenase [Sulfolobus sp. S-194]|uniref:SagB family peptide dehydrogenase n=1 Tax=Sulfolobus sp. S-194 TaxID=2512240 RepID=UPI0014372520|nr:SagB family peptide dehydrogenase [Sulfolobus sp. S-194]QIW23861.1 SagB/ThcOx family dehydrogenase [Sulfolobus sp. S-194]
MVKVNIAKLYHIIDINDITKFSPYSITTAVTTPNNYVKKLYVSLFDDNLLSISYLLNLEQRTRSLDMIIQTIKYNYSDLMQLILAYRDYGEEYSYNKIDLPKPKQRGDDIFKVIAKRRSNRTFIKGEMELDDLSTILYFSQGITTKVKLDLQGIMNENLFQKFRATPSGGALYPIDLYVISLNIRGLEKGIYKYQPYSHSLVYINNFNLDNLYKLSDFNYVNGVENVNVIILLASKILRSFYKYGELSLKLGLIEIGEIAYAIHLVSQALGYSSLDYAGFNKHNAEEIINIDGIFSHAVHMILVGLGGR